MSGVPIDVAGELVVVCQAQGCLEVSVVEPVLLRLDPGRGGGVVLRLCPRHVEALRVLALEVDGARTAELMEGVDQGG